jgi:hypothetical protein
VGSEVQILPGPPDGFCWARLVERVEVECGGVAQLGEHLLCKQGVIGSNPFTSIDRFYDQYLFHILRKARNIPGSSGGYLECMLVTEK